MTGAHRFDGAGLPRDAETGEIPDWAARRHEFVTEYCQDRDWDPNALTAVQILEIRAQPRWKDAGRD